MLRSMAFAGAILATSTAPCLALGRRLIRCVFIAILCEAIFFKAAYCEGLLKICTASDFDWHKTSIVNLPPRTIFEFAGKLCGDLYQPTELAKDDPRLACYNEASGRYDKEYEGGYVMTTESAILTSSAPCALARARILIFVPNSPRYARASNHEAWSGWRVLGFSAWHDDFGTPNGQPNGLGPLFDNFQIRAQIVADVDDPYLMSPAEHLQFQNIQ